MRQPTLIQEARDYLQAQGLARGTIAPPLFRLLWKLGIAVPPPLFLGFWANAALVGGFAGIGYGTAMSVLFWFLHGFFSLLVSLAIATCFGITLGTIVAGVVRVTAAKHQIPSWRRFVRSRAGQCAECGQPLEGASTRPECAAHQGKEMQAMSDTNALYTELKPDIAHVSEVLFDVSERLLRKHGNFLPHAAVVTTSGEVCLVAVAHSKAVTNATEVLPLVHDALRDQAKKFELRAVAVAENVTVTVQHGRPSQAIKVLCEHQRGLTVALYLPFSKRFFRRYVLGQAFTAAAKPEVRAWGEGVVEAL